MHRVVHFDIHADDPERAMRFYGELFGWTFPPYFPNYWGVVTGEEGTPGISGGLAMRRGPRPETGQPVSSFVCTVDVPSVDDCVARVRELGGSVAEPKVAIPGMAWLAYCIDTEGNIFGVYQDDPTAGSPAP